MKTLSLFELQKHIKRVIALNFDDSLWIEAEISQAQTSKGHTYINLIQKEEDSEQILAEAKGILWMRDSTRIQKKLGFEYPLKSLLCAGRIVKVLVQPQYSERYGLSLNLLDLDPSTSLGQLAAQRQQTLQQLKEEGLLEKNKNLRLPIVLQKIAVLSSATAAGYADFKSQLAQNPYSYAYEVQLYPIRVQGQGVGKDLLEQMNQIEQNIFKPDILLVLRGGGSKIDLSAFDEYGISQRIANSSIPVLSAIGHETDQSLVDLVAHQSVKTPTAAAEFLIDHNLSYEQQLLSTAYQILQQAQNSTKDYDRSFHEKAYQLDQTINQYITKKKNDLALIHQKLLAQSTISHSELLNKLNLISQELKLIQPSEILKRGYSLTVDEENQVVRDLDKLRNGQRLKTYFQKGEVESTILKIQKDER